MKDKPKQTQSFLICVHMGPKSEKTFKEVYSPFLCMGLNYLKAKATSRRQFTFYH